MVVRERCWERNLHQKGLVIVSTTVKYRILVDFETIIIKGLLRNLNEMAVSLGTPRRITTRKLKWRSQNKRKQATFSVNEVNSPGV